MTEEVKEKAIFYFHDRLSKFCPADKNRPNDYEITMFIAGYQVAMDEANERIQKLREALENISNTSDSDIMGKWISEYDLIEIARAALKEDDLSK